MSRTNQALKRKQNYSAFTLKEAMKLIPAEQFTRWQLPASPRPPSDFFKEDLRRLEAFDLKSSEQAKTLLIDALLVETVPLHPRLKVWKAATISTDTLTGMADYVMAPRRAYTVTGYTWLISANFLLPVPRPATSASVSREWGWRRQCMAMRIFSSKRCFTTP